MRQIGVLGGTFDPVHLGHLRPAVEVRAALGLDELRFLPCRVSPLRDQPTAAAEDRLQMLQLAIEGEPDLAIDARELDRPPPSYSVDTLAELRAEDAQARLHFVMGADAFAAFDQWHRWRDILELAHLVVTCRPGSPLEPPEAVRDRLTERPADLAAAACGRVLVQQVTQLDISATGVRRLAGAGGDLRYLMPTAVRQYLEQQQLYRGS